MLLKAHNRHFYDFTVHHVDFKKVRAVLEPPSFETKSSTILFVEGPEVPSASNLRASLSDSLRLSYGVDFDTFQKTFIVVTDEAAVMAKMANSSARPHLDAMLRSCPPKLHEGCV